MSPNQTTIVSKRIWQQCQRGAKSQHPNYFLPASSSPILFSHWDSVLLSVPAMLHIANTKKLTNPPTITPKINCNIKGSSLFFGNGIFLTRFQHLVLYPMLTLLQQQVVALQAAPSKHEVLQASWHSLPFLLRSYFSRPAFLPSAPSYICGTS